MPEEQSRSTRRRFLQAGAATVAAAAGAGCFGTMPPLGGKVRGTFERSTVVFAEGEHASYRAEFLGLSLIAYSLWLAANTEARTVSTPEPDAPPEETPD